MTGLEIENFYKLDKKEYVLENNKEFLKIYKEMIEKNSCYLKIEQLQNLIDEIVSFFEFKYPNKMFNDVIYNFEKNKDFYNYKDISKKMDIDALKYRLHHDYVSFLECDYPRYIELKYRQLANNSFMSSMYIKLEKDGSVDEYSLSKLKEIDMFKGLGTNESIESILEYLNSFINIPNDINLEQLEKICIEHKNKLYIRNKVLELVPLAILYSGNTLPIYGVLRAKSFVRMFNKEYNLNMSTEKIDEIMNKNYANLNYEDKVFIIDENKHENIYKNQRLKSLSKIFRKKNSN